MAIRLIEALNFPDVLDNNSVSILISPVQGISNNVASRHLYISGVNIATPPKKAGQVKVRMFGHSVAFRGESDNSNTFTASFYADCEGIVYRGLYAWFESSCSGFRGLSLRKREYARSIRIEISDTTGKIRIVHKISNAWLIGLTPPSSTTSSEAMMIEAEFSYDSSSVVIDGEDLTETIGGMLG